jgi:predicted lipoprotein with Yx(FWY)xxD motif
MKLLRIAPVAVLAAGALALSACGTDYAASSPSGAQKPASEDQAADGQAGGGQAGEVTGVKIAQKTGWTPFLSSADGWSVYRFDGDKNQPSTSNCNEDCAKMWMPVPAGVEVEGVDKSLVGSLTRKDNKKQLTIKGWPAYTHMKDKGPGDISGNGAMNKWFLMAPDGKKAKKAGQSEGGDEAVANGGTFITDKKFGEFDSAILVDERGMTLYRFDKDEKGAGTSACEGDAKCNEAWPPATGPAEANPDCVNPDLVTTFKRKDGKEQVSVAGWPMYYFAKDQKAGDALGHGVGDVWFAAKGDGSKANRTSGDNSAQDSGGSSSGGGDTGGGDGY